MKKFLNIKLLIFFVYVFLFFYALTFKIFPLPILILIYIIITFILAIIFKADLYAFLGNIYLSKGKIDKALELYELSIKNNTKVPTAYLNLGVFRLNQGNAKEAITLLEKAESLNKNIILDKNIKVSIASCYWALNDIDKAIDILENLRNSYEYVNINVITTLGYMYFLNHDYEKALEITNKALEEDPNSAAAWDSLGQIYFAKQDFNNAKNAFIKALSENNYLLESNYFLGIIYEQEENFEEAKKCFIQSKNCKISTLSYITNKEVEEKYNLYK